MSSAVSSSFSSFWVTSWWGSWVSFQQWSSMGAVAGGRNQGRSHPRGCSPPPHPEVWPSGDSSLCLLPAWVYGDPRQVLYPRNSTGAYCGVGANK